MDANDVVAVPASWWSSYSFQENDQGLIMEFGYSYCVESMVGLDWYAENHGEVTSVAAVGYPGDYGGDSAAGAQMWAEANGVSDVTVVPTAAATMRSCGAISTRQPRLASSSAVEAALCWPISS